MSGADPAGATFASRVAASLNHHLGFDEMNAGSDQAYIESAVRLAQDPAGLSALRIRVEEARKTSGLFDMAGYARDFEMAVTTMFKRHEAGYDAEDFEVT
jgi:predicted O-linked N-acetylglucosamine transferase (SPINDLY family)